ncbi:hypothetical protein CEXT_260381 [Caerostris extrusa]|uniref:Uncharacterized protein n=1 Tax=Caerostris extrusa TaxID=172846 RepID=A0AAV4Y179_CAEEX|nr:hypothetical protein CEXT_260381 [Caerostris extrusa]
MLSVKVETLPSSKCVTDVKNTQFWRLLKTKEKGDVHYHAFASVQNYFLWEGGPYALKLCNPSLLIMAKGRCSNDPNDHGQKSIPYKSPLKKTSVPPPHFYSTWNAPGGAKEDQ